MSLHFEMLVNHCFHLRSLGIRSSTCLFMLPTGSAECWMLSLLFYKASPSCKSMHTMKYLLLNNGLRKVLVLCIAHNLFSLLDLYLDVPLLNLRFGDNPFMSASWFFRNRFLKCLISFHQLKIEWYFECCQQRIRA